MENNIKEVLKEKWEEILIYMKTEYNITDVSYKTWLKNLKFYDIDENIVIVIIENSMLGDNALDFIRNKYGIFLKTAIAEITNEEFEIRFVLQSYIDELEEKQRAQKKEDNSYNQPTAKRNIYPKYTFENFVEGDNNCTARAAALAVAEAPGKAFNPLYIYGGPGLGKTHLMYAIANYIIEHEPDKKVLYVTSEQFTNDIVEALRKGLSAPEECRHKYRDNDVLLIDDIQFIIGKERTQEEFFHTFNEMRDANRQIIISSDKLPRDMTILDERMKSRFEWGFTADIQPPAYETRLAILLKKQQEENLNIDTEILKYIATNIKSNIRILESALSRIVTMSRLKRTPIDMNLAKEVLALIISPDEKKSITAELVIDVVAEHYDITPAMIISKNKSKNIAYPRQIAMYLCKQLTSMSLSEIGAAMGNRDHSTVIHGCRNIEDEKNKNPQLANTISVLIKKINPDD